MARLHFKNLNAFLKSPYEHAYVFNIILYFYYIICPHYNSSFLSYFIKMVYYCSRSA